MLTAYASSITILLFLHCPSIFSITVSPTLHMDVSGPHVNKLELELMKLADHFWLNQSFSLVVNNEKTNEW